MINKILNKKTVWTPPNQETIMVGLTTAYDKGRTIFSTQRCGINVGLSQMTGILMKTVCHICYMNANEFIHHWLKVEDSVKQQKDDIIYFAIGRKSIDSNELLILRMQDIQFVKRMMLYYRKIYAVRISHNNDKTNCVCELRKIKFKKNYIGVLK